MRAGERKLVFVSAFPVASSGALPLQLYESFTTASEKLTEPVAFVIGLELPACDWPMGCAFRLRKVPRGMVAPATLVAW